MRAGPGPSRRQQVSANRAGLGDIVRTEGAELPETETSDVMVTSGAHVVHVEHGSSTN